MLGIVRKLRGRAVKLLTREHQKWRLAPLYSPDPDDLDPERHYREALNWLKRAQDAGTDRGVSYGTVFGQDFDASYPETTGYICQTFVAQEEATKERDLLDRAMAMGDWQVDIQLPEGAVMGGMLNSSPTPAVFNTGMVLLGWAALIRRTGEDRYKTAARRASEWLVSIQEPNGHWIRGHSRFALPGPTLYNVMAAWGLCEAGVALEKEPYLRAAERNAEYCLSHQRANGWFANACLSDPRRPLLHTQAYCMQGLLGVGKILRRDDMVSGAALLADSQIRLMGRDGFLPGRQDASLRPAARWSCLTGSAQTSVVWGELFRLTGEEKYMAAIRRVNRYLMARHDIRNPDERLRGGVAGSWPVWGDYGRLSVLSWATKFLVDALGLELELELETSGRTGSRTSHQSQS